MPTTPSRRSMSTARRVTVAVVTLTLLIGPASAAVASPWFHEPFTSGETDVFTGWGWNGPWAGHDGPGLFTRIGKGSHYGATSQLELAALGKQGTDEMYWRYWLRLGPKFTIESGERGKLPGPAGLYSSYCKGNNPSTESRPCWSARTMFALPQSEAFAGQNRTLLGSYVYHLDQKNPSGSGDLLYWNEPAGLVDNGSWHCIEGRVRMNTRGKADGVLQNWVDGTLAFGRSDFRFRRKSEPQLHVKSFWMNVYYGGKVVSPADNDVWVDSLALSSRRVGCDDSDGYHFTDHGGSVHQADINWVGARGITRGCNPPENDHYCPDAAVTRAEMATFLTRSRELTPTDEPFVDVASDDTHAKSIGALAKAGITKGCNPPTNDRYCPDHAVTRAEMATFIVRAFDLPTASETFVDVAGDDTHARSIGGLAKSGITIGCNPPKNDRYCPDDPVTRAQMASFLRRAETH